MTGGLRIGKRLCDRLTPRRRIQRQWKRERRMLSAGSRPELTTLLRKAKRTKRHGVRRWTEPRPGSLLAAFFADLRFAMPLPRVFYGAGHRAAHIKRQGQNKYRLVPGQLKPNEV